MVFTIFSVRIDTLSRADAQEKVRFFFRSKGQNSVFTPNPEMLVAAHKDQNFAEILNTSSLSLCDGRGIELVLKGKIQRIPGVDFMIDICRIAQEEGKGIYLLGSGWQPIIEKTTQALLKEFPQLHIVGSDPGIQITETKQGIVYNTDDNKRLLNDIRNSSAAILFVAFGHGKQERWIFENLKDVPNIKVAMGVGGSFDYISGKVRRAPLWMRQVGLEWLWRLFRQPWRIMRIFRATFVFLFLYYLCSHKQSKNK